MIKYWRSTKTKPLLLIQQPNVPKVNVTMQEKFRFSAEDELNNPYESITAAGLDELELKGEEISDMITEAEIDNVENAREELLWK
ncbi:hypothetical protein OEV98_02455 [Caldibacillus lycopersici]|uniref:Uncharacterized protein n=1 Tax=Perspicuibacillus lycopersici TaxID=1325689 RepID=A0AAE3IRQ4_9BACI|nr:hypothetical protein [Perspicuibacillus lycopersici]MCU9612423.1 hypothetical protein [Perspicuibacillus lycopersici]